MLYTQTSPHLPYNKTHLILKEKRLKKWKIKVNEAKSMRTTFKLQKGKCPPPPMQINHTTIQQKDQAKRSLGLTFHSKLNWKHVLTKRKQMVQKIKHHWLIGKKSIDNKLQIHKAVSKTNYRSHRKCTW
ncbi:hypothetical protein B7P43_G18353 [Cryptotermes secundus]|uniref:Uncharacterized protein n=1 Tax=Cryptotermes secundus TaxID=105785 RepID=A0A2J7PV10_9NEOP|nr:hypothetical protein B7P43_G18353 [Cryptotermes secundus]